jgi:hypothetical protein
MILNMVITRDLGHLCILNTGHSLTFSATLSVQTPCFCRPAELCVCVFLCHTAARVPKYSLLSSTAYCPGNPYPFFTSADNRLEFAAATDPLLCRKLLFIDRVMYPSSNATARLCTVKCSSTGSCTRHQTRQLVSAP